jgi:hypothetical protein
MKTTTSNSTSGIVFQAVSPLETLAERVQRILENNDGQVTVGRLVYSHHVSRDEIDQLVHTGKFAVLEIRRFKRAGRPSRVLISQQ